MNMASIISIVRSRWLVAPLICAAIPLACIPAANWAAVSPPGSFLFLTPLVALLGGGLLLAHVLTPGGWKKFFSGNERRQSAAGASILFVIFAGWMATVRANIAVILLAPMFFALPLAFAGLPGGLTGLVFREIRSKSALVALGSLAFLAAVIPSLMIGHALRMEGLARAVRQSEPLVAAIRAYERDKGAPPPVLQALVPKYLPAVPSTGMRSYPDYIYNAGMASGGEASPWMLWISVPSGFMQFDRLVYRPAGVSLSSDLKGRTQRIGDWVYMDD